MRRGKRQLAILIFAVARVFPGYFYGFFAVAHTR
jgi:hypothetical protein